MHAFHCPHCSVTLRVRDATYRGRTIDCPECRRSVRIEDVDGRLTGVAVDAPLPGPLAPTRRHALWPRIAGGAAAMAVAIAVAWFAFVPGGPHGSATDSIPDFAREPDDRDPGRRRPAGGPAVAVPDPRDAQPLDVMLASDVNPESPPDAPLTASASQLPEPETLAAFDDDLPARPASDLPTEDPPLDVLFAEDGPAFDIADRLAQPILKFQPARDIALEDLLYEIQELLGAPIDVTALSAELRTQPISVSAEESTVGRLLEQVARSGNVTYEVAPERIVVTPIE